MVAFCGYKKERDSKHLSYILINVLNKTSVGNRTDHPMDSKVTHIQQVELRSSILAHDLFYIYLYSCLRVHIKEPVE